jgi:formylglycine-generating enzyme required for sulfatase activity
MDAGIVEPASCSPGGPGMTNCGTGGSESCCTSLLVTGGTFDRAYDRDSQNNSVVGPDGGATNESAPATLSDFQLDKYDVTVGRFRQFVHAWNGGAGYTPAQGSGKHTHLNGGLGLANSASPGTYEPGWDTANNSGVDPTAAHLACNTTDQGTWTTSAGSQESLPINCVSAYEAYAFCIWDGGFLPSDAELGYAEAGGAEQLEYPWGSASPGVGYQYAIAGDGAGDCRYPSGTLGMCAANAVTNIAPVGTALLGVGRWGQLDLLGNVKEWTLDAAATLVDPCVDCAYLSPATVATSGEVIRGCDDFYSPSYNNSSWRAGLSPTIRELGYGGFRCARTP